jgi:predicted AAA+ superfamily ATPase
VPIIYGFPSKNSPELLIASNVYPFNRPKYRSLPRVFHRDASELADLGIHVGDISGRILRGGYPEPLGRADMSRKIAWFDAYITTLLGRDVRDLSQVQDLAALPRLLQLLATRSASLFNQSEMSRTLAIPNSTLGRYLNLLQAIFLIQTIPAWSGNLGKRLVKTPKL